MRYFIATYREQPGGRYDEQVGFTKSLKDRDYASCNVILDLKKKQVVKCRIQTQARPGEVINLWNQSVQLDDFDHVAGYYREVYPREFAQVEGSLHPKPE
tara:strand:+ start:510 stop:809 length:300 start_codon:yes stop_codon:yes gene_type:complete